ncbi:plexin-B-like isoform X2 [Daphnia pulicaria]|uniref:plexin-B-like isoform X2 n=1 Tax=Daphnia pulicaria TaxID=35523 RepID=UPI001EECD09F|nr:plexin-B-like isoform X2 [Daphnia pulicaria]
MPRLKVFESASTSTSVAMATILFVVVLALTTSFPLATAALPDIGQGLIPSSMSSSSSSSRNMTSMSISSSRKDPSAGVNSIVKQFNWPRSSLTVNGTTRGFRHLTMDPSTGRIYAGGVNRLFQLDSSLSVEASVVTGPVVDSPQCHASGCAPSSGVDAVATDNVNKVLIVDRDARTLLACGSTSQGACTKYRLSNISSEPEFISRNVAANDETASTFAFIGPEHYNPWGRSNVLYVGTTFTSVGEYRHEVPAISSRNLYDLDFAEFSFTKQSTLHIDVKYRDHFLVKYVYGFNASDFAYFVVVQKKSHLPGEEESGYVTRLARTCISDANYDSYTEVTLQCGGGADGQGAYSLVQDAKLAQAGPDLANSLGLSTGDPVLVGLFSPPKGIGSPEPSHQSAVCVFSIADIEARFNENIHMCFNGSLQSRNMEYISGPILDGKCPKAGTTGNIHNFCEVGLKIAGIVPIYSPPALTYSHTLLTSVAVSGTEQHTVAFLGTSDGHLKKILLESGGRATEFEELPVDTGSTLLPDMLVDSIGEHVYTVSTLKISKVRVEHCATYTNCSSCLEARDPYCGWCSLEKRCTVKSACQKATTSSPRWLAYGSGQQCIDFEQVLPDRIPVAQTAVVQLTIRTLPDLPLGAKYKCVFGDADPIDATVTATGLSCPTPDLQSRPAIPTTSVSVANSVLTPSLTGSSQHTVTDHVLVPLSVRSSETNKDFVSRNFAYYDCSRHTTCSSCVKAQWACNWCVHENRCTHNASTCQRTVVSGENNPAHLMTHGAGYCPRLKRPADEDDLVPSGVARELVLEAENLPHPQAGHAGFQCLVDIEGAKMAIGARIEAGRYVVCDKTTYSYEANVGEYEAQVSVVWNGDHYVGSLPVTLYKCDILGSHRDHADCSLCVTRAKKYRCAWCGSVCAYSEACPLTAATECPRPRIDVIKPLSGPIEGGTLVTIEGSNLGLKEDDVKGKIRIGDIPCELIDYQVSVKIICRTGPAPTEIDAPVIIGNTAGYTESTVKYSYKDLELHSVFPTFGPQSGGTLLSITGFHLNMGSSVSAFLDELPCLVNSSHASGTRLLCTSSRTAGPRTVAQLTVTIDNAKRVLAKNPFSYTKDPTIMEVKPLRSFASGGRLLSVHGTNLDSIQKPQMAVYMDDGITVANVTVCRVVSASHMECPSPPVDFEALINARRMQLAALTAAPSLSPLSRRKRAGLRPHRDVPRSVTLRIGFLMDNVESVRDLKKHFQQLQYVEDPSYSAFVGASLIKLYKGDTLVIEGENLNLASDETDVNVTIGTRSCNVTSLAATQLVCTPPEVQPTGTDEIGIKTESGLPLVVVRVGQNVRFPIGYLQYEVVKPYTFPPEAIGGITAGGILLVLVSIAILLVYRRKSTQAEREYKRIQIQMDTLESNVRSECKQAFAELQTDMTDLTADLQSLGTPTLDHKTYVMKVFFPGVNDHPILNDPKRRLTGPRTNYDAAMMQFEQLICNKHFLLTFIETLESQRDFSIRDKVNVASLLVVTLMGNMEYATSVLRSLLFRLMEKAVSTKHPQLMLRRTESVVEKMLSNWMALSMYHYLKDRAGQSIFVLFKAIKYQVEKGPVDSLTHDARYSLSEERLLREQIDHSFVTIHLVQEDHYEKIPYQPYHTIPLAPEELEEKIQCRVLDCDTISQVKHKILDALYRHTPFSLRPAVYEVDLEWRQLRGGSLILSDEDGSSKIINGWKKLNTLAHYGVKESAVMSLVPRKMTNCTMTNGHCKSSYRNCVNAYHFNSTLTHAILQNGNNVSDPENGVNHLQTFHLVRPPMDDTKSNGKQWSPNGQMDRTPKAIPEIFLTRLLSTKGTIEKYVVDFFRTILTVDEHVPPAIKWLFDLLDEGARKHNITDPEVLHAWKSNSLPLRFWVNFIKNPDFVFDIYKTNTVDSCLSVIAQTFMDSCSTTEHRLGKDSPSNKLLFAKDIPKFREMVSTFYQDVSNMPQIPDQEMNSTMQQLSMSHIGEFDTVAALKELYIYVNKYRVQLFENLEEENYCRKLQLAQRLANVACVMEGEETSAC